MTGGDRRWRTREFEKGSNPVTYVDQVVSTLPDKVAFLGQVVGFYINFTPNYCVEFDREGRPLVEYNSAKRMGPSSACGMEKLLFT